MRNVMWKGELAGRFRLDTVADPTHLYGVGPVAFLRGELMLIDGKMYRSRVTSDSTMAVDVAPAAEAPFFVYARAADWRAVPLPESVTDLARLEAFVDEQRGDRTAAFPFRLAGRVDSALIHVQNLAPGTQVSSPAEAHSGQVKYPLGPAEAILVGFFSTDHHGVFTHHDTNIHVHLITEDRRWMGHLDAVNIAEMTLYLPF